MGCMCSMPDIGIGYDPAQHAADKKAIVEDLRKEFPELAKFLKLLGAKTDIREITKMPKRDDHRIDFEYKLVYVYRDIIDLTTHYADGKPKEFTFTFGKYYDHVTD